MSPRQPRTTYYKFLGLLFIGMLLRFSALAQDPNFTQFYSQPVQYNPAFTGINNGLRFGAIFRNQWSRIPGQFNTYSIALDAEALNLGGGLGFSASHDVEGEGLLSTTNFNALYAYRVVQKDWMIQAGFSAGAYTQRLDFSKLIFTDQLDDKYGLVRPTATGAVPTPVASKTFVDFTSGFVFRKNIRHKTQRRKILATVNAGYAAHHITRPDQSLMLLDARLPIRHSFQLNAAIPINGLNDPKHPALLIPALLFESQMFFKELVMGVNAVKEPLFGGVFYRSRVFKGLPNTYDVDALAANLGFETQVNKNVVMRFCYSYDITVNNLRGFSPGTHEIGILLWNKNLYKKGRNAKKSLTCYSF